MNWKRFAKEVAWWTLPRGFYGVLEGWVDTSPREQAQLLRNKKFANLHRGQRCFILATGQSIREHDLRPLQHEHCIAVNEFYKHEQYDVIRPAYYAMPATRSAPLDDAKRMQRLRDIKRVAQREVFFFHVGDQAWVEQSGFMDDPARVHYLDLTGDFIPDRLDLTRRFPDPWSVALMAVWIAVYMGFSEVYLLGCDHSVLWQWNGRSPYLREHHYQHFYRGAPTVGYEPVDLEAELRSMLELRRQYKWTVALAASQGTRILNANPNSYLDVVPKVNLASVLS